MENTVAEEFVEMYDTLRTQGDIELSYQRAFMLFTGRNIEFYSDPYLTNLIGNQVPINQLQVLDLGISFIKKNAED